MKLSAFFEAVAAPELRQYDQVTTKKTTNPAYPREYLADLTEWPEIRKDIKSLLDPYLDIDSERFDRFSGQFNEDIEAWSWCGDENNVVRLGGLAYEGPVKMILRSCFQIRGDFDSHRAAFNIGDPDRVFFTLDKSGQRDPLKFLVEWKTPWALPTPTNLIKQFNETRDNPKSKIAKAISQVYGYMTFNDLMFGALCNYEALYLLRRAGDLGLQVSPPFRFSDRGTHTFTIEKFDVKGTWDDDIEVPWSKMNLHLRGSGRKNIASVVSGDITPKRGVKFSCNVEAVFKVYDITTSEGLEAADSEIEAYKYLEPLYGKYIPRLYAAGTARKLLKILVLEDCGKAACQDNIDKYFWTKAKRCIQAIHKSGAIHGDIKLDNFAISQSGVRVIDLGRCREGNSVERASEFAELESLEEEWDTAQLVAEDEEDHGELKD
ncbi:uncharacterized protein DFL_000092 [Arthrobotrys flagrans]|uniref:Protein kinase domain-containing protein n=1 Tax=Arthrobotrys flagrans TaxID=97331 RepID=A0A437AE75_ARTFL|nr:hypothetical protein DFL_000092 [Arthrobotrys flagrans]